MRLFDKNTGIKLGFCPTRTRKGVTRPIRNHRRQRAIFSTHRECNHWVAGFANYYGVPAWLECVNNMICVTFRRGITTYQA